jgi:hypothetical protein
VKLTSFLVDRRGDNRHMVQFPLVVKGRTRDGLDFEEQTVLENISLKGGYFLLQNDPDPRDEMQVHLKLAPMHQNNSTMSLRTRVVRRDDEADDRERRGIAVTFQ